MSKTLEQEVLNLLSDGNWYSAAEVNELLSGTYNSTLSTLAHKCRLDRKREGLLVIYKIGTGAVSREVKADRVAEQLAAKPEVTIYKVKTETAVKKKVERLDGADGIVERLLEEAKIQRFDTPQRSLEVLNMIRRSTTLSDVAKLAKYMPGCDWHYLITGETL